MNYVKDTGLNWSSLTKRNKTDHIQIHHTVGDYGTPAKWKALHNRRIQQGQRGVPYSYLVLDDGTIYLGRGMENSHGGVKDSLTNRANQRSVAIAFNGDMRQPGKPTDAALNAAVRLVKDIMATYDLDVSKVIGHNEVPLYSGGKPTGKTYATACPSIDMDKFRRALQSGTVFVPIPVPEPPSNQWAVDRVLKLTNPMMRGEDVEILQKRLLEEGFRMAVVNGVTKTLTADGIFGAITEGAVKLYQKANKLTIDGKAGRNTITRLGGIWAK